MLGIGMIRGDHEMAKVITGTHGRINTLLKGIPNDEILGIISSADGKLSVLVKTNGVIGTPMPSDEKEKWEQHCAELEEALADCKTRCEMQAREKDDALKEFVKENASLNKQLEKCQSELAKKDKAIEGLRQDLEKVKSALKALE